MPPKPLDELLAEAIARPAGPERDAWLAGACGGDRLLERELGDLIAAHEGAGTSFMAEPAVQPPAAAAGVPSASQLAAQPDTRIGPYRLLRVLGEGGFGVVYLAEQERPVRREVALKIIKPGMDTEQLIARFEAERQALAMMDHPGIAKVLDAGETDGGRPYFVMEYVRGVPITTFCDEQRYSTRQRLELFVQVCKGVQHAHLKGIVHRDLKPNNVLVTQTADGPAPSVIDFGIAKATLQPLTERTALTAQYQFVGTPAYMSPEQARGARIDIDTRSDVYTLGVLLYRLLTGTTPIDAGTVREAGFLKLQRLITEEEPPKPSSRVAALESGMAETPRTDDTSSRALFRELRGELDWITMRCLEKDRARRYETVSALAEDIARHLNEEPVLAGPPSTTYRLRKFVRRNRAAVAAGLLIVGALVGGAGAATIGLVRAVDAEARAEEEAEQAKTDKAIAEAVNQFLNEDLLAAVAPSVEQGRGKDVLMREVLDEAARSIERASAPGGRFVDQALVEASIRLTIGETYERLGEFDSAEPHLERARALRGEVLGAEHPDTLACSHSLAVLYSSQGRFDEAEAMLFETQEAWTRVQGEEHPDTLAGLNNIAALYSRTQRYDEAEAGYTRALEVHERVLGEEHEETLKCLNNLASVYSSQGCFDEAEPLMVRSLELHQRVLGEEHPQTLFYASNLASLFASQQRWGEAEPLLFQTLETQRRVLGEEHPQTLFSLNNVGNMLAMQGRFADAEPYYGEALELRVHVLGEEHPDTLASMHNLALACAVQDHHEDAEPIFLRGLEVRRRAFGETDAETLAYMTTLVGLFRRWQREEAADALARELEELRGR